MNYVQKVTLSLRYQTVENCKKVSQYYSNTKKHQEVFALKEAKSKTLRDCFIYMTDVYRQCWKFPQKIIRLASHKSCLVI